MVRQYTREQIAKVADIHAAPPIPGRNVAVDRTFEMPVRLYASMVTLCLGFVAVTALGFGNANLIIPMAVFSVFIAGFFAIPAIWTRLAPDNPVKHRKWDEFRRAGIHTNAGHNTAAEASIQVLLLPVLLFLWGVTTVTIAAIVR